MSSPAPDYVYSIDEEQYFDDLDEFQEQLYYSDLNVHHGHQQIIKRGTKLNCTHADFVTNDSIESMFQQINNNAQNFVGEHADDYIFDLEPEQLKYLRQLVLSFVQSNYDEPKFWQATNIQNFKITADFSKIKPEIFEAIS